MQNLYSTIFRLLLVLACVRVRFGPYLYSTIFRLLHSSGLVVHDTQYLFIFYYI